MALLRKLNAEKIIASPSPATLSSDEQLKQKLHFLQFHQTDLDNLRKLTVIVDANAKRITDRHYELLQQLPAMKQLIGKHSTVDRLTQTFTEYLKSLPRVKLDQAYIESRIRIGLIHSHIDLKPEWFVGSFTRIYEWLVPAILNKFAGAEAASVMISLNRILTLDAQLVLEAYQSAHEYSFIETNSRIIEAIIQMDKVRPLLRSVESSIEETTNVSAATEQLSSSIQEVAGYAVQTAQRADDMIQEASEGERIIRETLNDFLATAQQFGSARGQFEQLKHAIEEVTEVTDFIRDVADQTNLLSLNAAIEAARAGEEGRGFAVVANEVRKLAEQTKTSVDHITDMILNVRRTADYVDAQTQQMGESISSRAEHAQEAIVRLNRIVSEISGIGDSTSNIAAIVEEQAAATDDISTRAAVMLTHQEQMQQHAVATGRDLYEISKRVNELRLKSLENMPLSEKQTLRVVKTDHLLWRWWVYNSLLGFHTMSVQDMGDHHMCRLGKWYASKSGDEKIRSLDAYRAIDEPHAQIHQLAREAAALLESDSAGQLDSVFADIEQASGEVVKHLDLLRQHLFGNELGR